MALGFAARDRVRACFADVGLERVLTLRAARRIERRNHLEVWGEP